MGSFTPNRPKGLAMLILMSVCLIGSPTSCHEERINLSLEDSGSMMCLLQAQPLIAQWQESHAQWHVERWRCASARTIQNDI